MYSLLENKQMKVYLAAMYSLKDDIRLKAEDLKQLGIQCTSTWLKEPHDPKIGINEVTPEFCCETAHQDLDDILRSDVVVLFTVDGTIPTLRGGRHFESGFAYGISVAQTIKNLVIPNTTMRPMRVMTVGPKENIFHHLESIVNCATWQNAMACLLDYKKYVDEYDAMCERRLAEGSAESIFSAVFEDDKKKQN